MNVDSIAMPADVTGEPFAGDPSIISTDLKRRAADYGAVYVRHFSLCRCSLLVLTAPHAALHTLRRHIRVRHAHPLPYHARLPLLPSTAKLLFMEGNIRIILRKRRRIGLPDGIVGKEVEVLEKVVGRGEVKEVKGDKEGVLFARGVIGAGKRA